jgi:putative cardiolipin synthase
MQELYTEDDPEKIAEARATVTQEMTDAGDSIYAESISTPVIKQLAAQEVAPFVAQANLIWDKPDKLLESVSDDQKIVAGDLREAFLSADSEIIIFTPYLIPRKGGMELIEELRAKDIRIVILTNSLATNNHTSVFSAYQKYRKGMLQAGVELYEARGDAAKTVNADGDVELEQLTLHTKGVLIDRERIFAGSLNLDPRSIDINTEMGLLIDSPELTQLLVANVEQNIPKIAYRLQLDENDKITWHATIDGKEVVETKEPQTSGWQRFKAWFLRIAPENQL